MFFGWKVYGNDRKLEETGWVGGETNDVVDFFHLRLAPRLVPQGVPAELMLLFVGAICSLFGILTSKEWRGL